MNIATTRIVGTLSGKIILKKIFINSLVLGILGLTMADITYCTNTGCPFKKCERHLSQLESKKDKTRMVSVANLGGVCREYLNYVYEEVKANEHNKKN